MCKHTEIVLASRNAIVALRESLPEDLSARDFMKISQEFSRREVAYDTLLEDLDKECESCVTDLEEANHACFLEVCDCFAGRDFLRFVDEFVTHFGGRKCPDCDKYYVTSP